MPRASVVKEALQLLTQDIPVTCIDAKGRKHAIGGKRSLARYLRNATHIVLGKRKVSLCGGA